MIGKIQIREVLQTCKKCGVKLSAIDAHYAWGSLTDGPYHDECRGPKLEGQLDRLPSPKQGQSGAGSLV